MAKITLKPGKKERINYTKREKLTKRSNNAPATSVSPLQAWMPSLHVWAKLGSSLFPQLLNHSPPEAQQLRSPVILNVPHTRHPGPVAVLMEKEAIVVACFDAKHQDICNKKKICTRAIVNDTKVHKRGKKWLTSCYAWCWKVESLHAHPLGNAWNFS